MAPMSRVPASTRTAATTPLDQDAPIPLTGVLSVLLGAALFGTLGPLSRFAYDEGMTPSAWVTWRAGFGALALLVYVAWRIRTGRSRLARPGDVTWRGRAAIIVAALTAFTLNLAMFAAFDRITIALALLGFYLYPALIAVANALLGRERLDRTRQLALGLSLVGMVAVVATQLDPASGIRFDAIGLGLALGAALSQVVFLLVSQKGYRAVPTEQAMGFILLVTAVSAALVTVAVSGVDAVILPFRAPTTLLPLLLGVGVFAAAIPSLLFLTGVRRIGGLRAGILMLFEPVVGVVLAAWFLRESLGPIQILGAAAILAAAVILQRGSRTPDAPIPGGP